MEKGNGLERAKTLADAVSAQAVIANRSWFAMMTVALVSVLPPKVSADTVTLPFTLGFAPISWFYPVVYLLLVILVIAFSSAHSQQITAQIAAQDALDRIGPGEETHRFKAREWFDMWRKPTMNRVGPLPMSLSLVFSKKGSQKLGKRVVKIYYAILKIVALTIYFGFPLSALWYVYLFRLGSISKWLFLCGVLLATWTLLQVLIIEISYAKRAGQHI